MKTFLLTTLLLIWIPPLGLRAAEPAKQGLAEIIASIPTRSSLEASIRDLDRGSSRPSVVPRDGEPVVPTLVSREEATAILRKAQNAFNQLRTTLKVGTSIFDYPGILALGTPAFSGGANGNYRLKLGIPPGWAWAQEQGANPDEFSVDFDSKGVITQIAPVVYKH
ncbi:MAG: hypothetical protein JWO08_2557 [Verrucomicrobiaceae bacterium]|nr:hypothetical protein [Verrucomicrobiaceae bacterium]